MFKNKKILITGGTGSLGSALTKKLLETDVDTIRIFSRDELKQSEMQASIEDSRLRYFIGDIRDKERISRALDGVNIVIHTAALKQVPVAEYNPFEAVKTNVYGAQNLIEACLENEVELALAIGTDKAVSPLNTYGATKLLMEKLFVSANHIRGNHDIKFLCVRYGNVLGSRGSIVPKFIQQIKNGKKITVTNPNMTRFNIIMSQALDLTFRAIQTGGAGEIFIPKLKAYRVGDLKDVILDLFNAKNETEIISLRPGEKSHELLINKDEIRNTYETQKDYIIFDKQSHIQFLGSSDIIKREETSLQDQYSSDRVELLKPEELKKILLEEKFVI